MRGDTWSAFGQAHPMILCAEYGLHFAKEGDHWRCAEYPDLVMLLGNRYRVGDRTFCTLCEAMRHLDRSGRPC
jgi:hypothetical protein